MNTQTQWPIDTETLIQCLYNFSTDLARWPSSKIIESPADGRPQVANIILL